MKTVSDLGVVEVTTCVGEVGTWKSASDVTAVSDVDDVAVGYLVGDDRRR